MSVKHLAPYADGPHASPIVSSFASEREIAPDQPGATPVLDTKRGACPASGDMWSRLADGSSAEPFEQRAPPRSASPAKTEFEYHSGQARAGQLLSEP